MLISGSFVAFNVSNGISTLPYNFSCYTASRDVSAALQQNEPVQGVGGVVVVVTAITDLVVVSQGPVFF